jgi:predicted nuclease with TOPRIM domain
MDDLQTITDAIRAYMRLQRDLGRYKKWFNEEVEKNDQLEKTNAVLRGQITNLKERLKDRILVAEYKPEDKLTLITGE